MLRNTLIAFVIMMVAGGQIVGMQRGYICNHGTVLRETLNEHCHDDGSSDEDQSTTCESDIAESCDSKGGKQRHAPLNETFQAPSPAATGLSVPSYVSILLVEMPDFTAIIRSVLMETNAHHALLAHAKVHHGMAADDQVTHCVVMLI